MVTHMAFLMIFFMKGMYYNIKINSVIIALSFLVFIISLTFLRTQTQISDIQYMKAMIPHHSAIMTSKNANLKDSEVKKLAEKILISYQEEIKLVKKLLIKIE